METVTQQIGAFVRDNGGNAWDALNVALARLDLATARAEAAEAEVERLLEFQRECLLPHEANDLGNDLDEAKAECERLREAAIAYDNEHEPDEYGLKWGAHVSERAYLAFVAAFGIDKNAAGG